MDTNFCLQEKLYFCGERVLFFYNLSSEKAVQVGQNLGPVLLAQFFHVGQIIPGAEFGIHLQRLQQLN